MANTIEVIFENKPLTWGLRGDPHLWDELKETLKGMHMPNTADEMNNILYNQFKILVGELPVKGKNIYVSRYPRLGMSGGVVCSDYWIDKGFPILIERWQNIVTS